MFKKITRVSVSLFLSLMLMAIPAFADGTVPENTGRLKVKGNAVVTVSPDIAHITLGVETSHSSAERATQENARKMANVFVALKNLELEDYDISTSGYSVYSYDEFKKNSDNEDVVVTTYKVRNNINIKTKDLNETGTIVDVAVKAGANQIHGIWFDLNDKQELQLQALKLAIDQAKAKGTAMADASGISLGGIASLTEDYATHAPMQESMMMRNTLGGSAGTSFNPGDVEITAQVTIEYWF